MMIDSHVHYSCNNYDGEFPYLSMTEEPQLRTGRREDLLQDLREIGVGAVVEPAIGLESNRQLLALSEREKGFLWPAVGVHPTRTWASPWKERKQLPALARRPQVVAIGETGLDYHYPRRQQHRLVQRLWFEYQLQLAWRMGLPLILHIREADQAALRILKRYKDRLHGGVVHCFNGSWETAQQYLDLGLHLGIGGTILQENERGARLRQAVRQIPLDRILVETDAPWVLPDVRGLCSGKKGGRVRNSSLILPAVLAAICKEKGCTQEEARQTTTQNAIHLFHLPF